MFLIAECPNVAECPALPAPANVSVDISGPQPLGTVATYSCDYFLTSGDLVRYCITGGTWSGTEPTCAPG